MHRVVIVGCGFGGLFAARRLRHADVEVTVVDRTNHHLFQPLLYQLSTGILSEGDIAPPIRDVLRKYDNTSVLLGEVVDIDVEARELTVETLERTATVPYDSLIVATGSQQSYFGHDEFARYAPGMKTIDDALELRARIFGAFEMAECEPDPALRERWMTFVVVGAGATGVEMAGQISELAHRSLNRNYRSIDPAMARVVLLDAAPKMLGAFPDSLQASAQRRLTRMGVEIHLNTMVTGVDEDGIETNSEDPRVRRIESATKMWAAGVEASAFGRLVAEATGCDTDRAGRLKVSPDCTVPGHREIFVIGDLMDLNGLPGVAEVAMQSGMHAAKIIRRRADGEDSAPPFKYHDLGSMATVSRFSAIATIGPIRASGFIGWLMWLGVHLMFLTGFKNRFAVVANWFISFVGRGRPQRAITRQQVIARQAIEELGVVAAHRERTTR